MLELKNVSYSAGEDDGGVKDILTDVSLCVNERFVAVTGLFVRVSAFRKRLSVVPLPSRAGVAAKSSVFSS